MIDGSEKKAWLFKYLDSKVTGMLLTDTCNNIYIKTCTYCVAILKNHIS